MKPSKILEMAAMHIRKYGHAKHQMGTYGKPCCALGAVYVITDDCAATKPPVTFLTFLGGALVPLESVIFLERALKTIGIYDVAKWNDRPETTAGAVFNALWAAAKLARSEGK